MNTQTNDLSTDFEGNEIACVKFRGRYCWIARQVGQALGYSNKGKRMVANLTGDWSDEMALGEHYDILAGTDLREFKVLFNGAENTPLKTNSAVTVIYEDGLNLIFLLTKKTRGKALRRHLSKTVLKQIARDGKYSPDREVVDGVIIERVIPGTTPDDDLEMRKRALDLEDRRFQIRILTEAIQANEPFLSKEAHAALMGQRAEIAMGRQVNSLKPRIDPDFITATEAAGQIGVSAWRFGHTAKELGLRADLPGTTRVVMGSRKNSEGNCKQYHYAPNAIEQVRVECVRLGYIADETSPPAQQELSNYSPSNGQSETAGEPLA